MLSLRCPDRPTDEDKKLSLPGPQIVCEPIVEPFIRLLPSAVRFCGQILERRPVQWKDDPSCHKVSEDPGEKTDSCPAPFTPTVST